MRARKDSEHVSEAVQRLSAMLDQAVRERNDAHSRAVADQEETVAWAKSLDKALEDLRDAHARTVTDHEETVAWAKVLEGDLSQAHAAAKAANEEVTEARAALDRTMTERDQATRRIQILDDELFTARRRIELLEPDAALAHQLLASHSWRLTRPLRFAARLIRGDWRAVRAGVQPVLLRVASAIYRRLPLNAVHQRRLAWLVYRVTGSLFEGNSRL